MPLPGASRPNQRWSMDFVSDRLADGRWFRILTVVDQYTRECLCVHAERSQTGRKVVEQLSMIVAERGAPESITSDNGLNAREKLSARAHRGPYLALGASSGSIFLNTVVPVGLPHNRDPAHHNEHKICTNCAVFTAPKTA